MNCLKLRDLIEDCRDNITLCEDDDEESKNLEILEGLFFFCNATDKSSKGNVEYWQKFRGKI